MSLNLLYHKFQILQNFFVYFTYFFSFFSFFIIKTAHLHDFRCNLCCYFCLILTIFVFYFLYTIYKKSQSLFTEKILGFHFYIKLFSFLRMFSFYSLVFAASFFLYPKFLIIYSLNRFSPSCLITS